jgi:hypothetical protein
MFAGWRIFSIIETGRDSVMQRWRWLCVGPNGECREADRGFATVLACRADAFKNGLNPDTPVQVDTAKPWASRLNGFVPFHTRERVAAVEPAKTVVQPFSVTDAAAVRPANV